MAKKKVYDIIYSAVVKHLRTKQGNVTSLPNDDQIKKGMRKIFRQLKDGGYNPVSADKVIKTEADLNTVLRNINEKKIADIKRRKDASEGIETVLDKINRGIPLNPGDQAKIEGAGMKTTLDAFQGFKPKVIQGGKNLTMKTPGGEIPYIESPTQTIIQGGKEVPVKIPKGIKDDVKEASDDVSPGYSMGDTKYNADVLALNLAERRGFIKEGQDATDMPGKEYSKLYSEAYDYLTKLNFLNRPPRKPKKAGGGLIKAMAKLKKKYGKDIIQKGKAPKDKGGRKKLRQMFKDFEERTKKEGGGLAYMLGEPREELAAGGPALRRLMQFLNKGVGKTGSQGLKEMKLPKQIKFFAEKQGFDPDQIRINYLEQVLEALKADRKMMRGLEPDAPSAVTGKAKDEMELMADDIFKNQFLRTTQEGRFKGLSTEMIDSSIMELEGILKNLKTKGRKLNAEGGLAGYGPYQMDKQPGQPGPMGPTFETNDPKEALKEVLARMEGVGIFQAPLGGGFSFDTGVGGRRPIDAGISFNPQDPRFDFQTGVGVKDGKPSAGFQFRMPFKDGGMSRRTFLKIMAALAAFPVVGKLAKTTKVAKGVKPIVTPTAEMPAHFPKLVEKILREGQVVKKDFIKKTGDVTTYKHPDRPDIELTVEGEGNRIQLDFETDQGMKAGYEFRKGEIIDDIESPMRGKRGPNEFNQGEVKYRTAGDGYTKDFEEGIDTGTENLDEFAGMGKQKTSKSKVNLDAYDDLAVPDEDLADGGLAGLLGE